MGKKPRTVELTTEYEALTEAEHTVSYPRPQMRRDGYSILDGEWDFRIENHGKQVFAGKIRVPFPPESRLSGVGREISPDDVMIYERKFSIWASGKRCILHVGACDQYAEVYVNGALVRENEGGYLPIDIDVSEFVKDGENSLKIVARDPMCRLLPYGKQTDKPGGMWYRKISGIWQTVWLELVPKNYIEGLKITPDLRGVDIEVVGGEGEKLLIFDGKEQSFYKNKIRLEVENPRLWSPSDPYLYEFSVRCGEDEVHSYFGLREIKSEKINGRPRITLNGEPIFLHGLLDQGYFSDGIFLPAADRGFEDDVMRAKECGFNCLRKHIKIEPDVFYYLCDKLGMLVLQDAVSCGNYSFLYDTALPTVGLRCLPHRFRRKATREQFIKTMEGMISHLYSHPSVVYYTVFNEGWGQFSSDEMYKKVKALDPTRICDTTSGWFKKKLSDVESEHVYFKPVKLKYGGDRPTVLSEFGGYSCKIEGHSYNLDKTYGYRFYSDVKEFESALIALYENEVIPEAQRGLCGAILTQLSDVEDETNGILTFDRRVIKVSPEKMRRVAEKLEKAVKSKS